MCLPLESLQKHLLLDTMWYMCWERQLKKAVEIIKLVKLQKNIQATIFF